MPNCFQLTKIGETEASSLSKIDEEICAEFGFKVDERRYAFGWFDAIGYRLACNESFDTVIKEYEDVVEEDDEDQWTAKMLEIAKFLKGRYTAKAWYQRHSA